MKAQKAAALFNDEQFTLCLSACSVNEREQVHLRIQV